MTQKFGRNYRLTIFPTDGSPPILITMPFTLKISLERSWSSKQNMLELEIYNLSENNRNLIYQDWNFLGLRNEIPDPETGFPLDGNNIILEAGYDNLYRIFTGVIWRAESGRVGNNIITRVSAWGNNADLETTRTFQTLRGGQTLSSILQTLIGEFPQLRQGNELDYPLEFTRPVVLNGVTWDLLKQYSNANVYIDNGKIYILRDNEALNLTTVIDDSTGILETPRRSPGGVLVKTIFEPSVNVGQLVDIQSNIQSNYNGVYSVRGISHQGMISGASCGKMETVFELQAPNPFNGFTQVNQL